MKTTVMMLGEYEYEQNLFSTESLPYPTATNILFIVFIGKKTDCSQRGKKLKYKYFDFFPRQL